MTAPVASAYRMKDLVYAGIPALVVPVMMAFAIHRLAPWGCDASAWLCLFPFSLLCAAPIAALFLPALVFLNQRRSHPFFTGWLIPTALTGCASQLLVTACQPVNLWAGLDRQAVRKTGEAQPDRPKRLSRGRSLVRVASRVSLRACLRKQFI